MARILSLLKDVFISYFEPHKRIWTLESSSRFSSKSFFEVFTRSSLTRGSFPHKKIWKPLVPPRVKAFLWMAILDRINSMDMLRRRLPFMTLFPLIFPLRMQDGEVGNHIMIQCKFQGSFGLLFFNI